MTNIACKPGISALLLLVPTAVVLGAQLPLLKYECSVPALL